MNDKMQNSTLWIAVPLVLIAVFNVGLFFLYDDAAQIQAQKEENELAKSENREPKEVERKYSERIWGYVESDPFKGITASLLFPIFIFLVERRFKIIEKREDEKREKQWECIEYVQKTWQELYQLATEVSFFAKQNNEKEKAIGEIFKKVSEVLTMIINSENLCKLRFPNLQKITDSYKNYFPLKLISRFLEVQLEMIISVTQYIKDNDSEIDMLQKYLSINTREIHRYSFSRVLNMLKYSMDLFDSSISSKEKSNIKKELLVVINEIQELIDEIDEFEYKKKKLLDPIGGPKVDDYRSKADEYSKKMTVKDDKVIYDQYAYDDRNLPLITSFNNIPLEERLRSDALIYSKKYIEEFANCYTEFLALKRIADRRRMKEVAENRLNVREKLKQKTKASNN